MSYQKTTKILHVLKYHSSFECYPDHLLNIQIWILSYRGYLQLVKNIPNNIHVP